MPARFRERTNERTSPPPPSFSNRQEQVPRVLKAPDIVDWQPHRSTSVVQRWSRKAHPHLRCHRRRRGPLGRASPPHGLLPRPRAAAAAAPPSVVARAPTRVQSFPCDRCPRRPRRPLCQNLAGPAVPSPSPGAPGALAAATAVSAAASAAVARATVVVPGRG